MSFWWEMGDTEVQGIIHQNKGDRNGTKIIIVYSSWTLYPGFHTADPNNKTIHKK